jgi:hypothetical protein
MGTKKTDALAPGFSIVFVWVDYFFLPFTFEKVSSLATHPI